MKKTNTIIITCFAAILCLFFVYGSWITVVNAYSVILWRRKEVRDVSIIVLIDHILAFYLMNHCDINISCVRVMYSRCKERHHNLTVLNEISKTRNWHFHGNITFCVKKWINKSRGILQRVFNVMNNSDHAALLENIGT